MLNDTTLLLDLDGVSVQQIETLTGGARRVHLITVDESARACSACGVFATRIKGPALTRPRDLPYGERGLEFIWHKRRWWCREPACPRKSFTETTAQIPAGARMTERLRAAAGTPGQGRRLHGHPGGARPGRQDAACSATGKTSLTSSSRRCGTRCRPKGR